MKFAPFTAPILGSTLVSLLLATSGVAMADKAVDKAEEQLANLRFDEARNTAKSALKEGSRGPSEVVDLYMLLGQVSASTGKESDAVNFFHNALSIDIDATLPSGSSPKLSEPFDKAKSRLEGASPITLEFKDKGGGRVIVKITSDPANLVGGAALLYSQDGKEEIKKGRGRNTVKMKIPEGASNARIAAVDFHGNRLNDPVDLGQSGSGSGEATTVALGTKTDEAPGRPLFSRWQLYAGLAVGAALGGGYYGFKSRGFIKDAEALEDGTEFSEAQRLEDLAKEKALYANIGFVAAALLAGTSYWVYSSNAGKKETPPTTTTSLTPYLTPEGAGFSAAFRF